MPSPQVTGFGTPALVRATSGSVTGSWGTGQNRTAGHLLGAVVTAGGSTASAAAISTPAGWTQRAVISNVATTANTWAAVYTKTAAGSDSAPAFTATLTGAVAMTVTLLELPAAAVIYPVDTFGTYASGGSSGSLTSMSATTANLISAAGAYAIGVFVQEAAAATNTWNPGSGGWANLVNDGATSTVLHSAVDFLANPAAGSTLTEAGSWTTHATAFGAGIVLVIAPQTGGLELYTNDASTTISSGGTGAPAAGTPELWTAASWASFPTASPSTTPPVKFHIADPALPGELIEVLNTATGLVVRGAQGTTPVAHSGGFTVQNVIPAGAGQQRCYNVRDPQYAGGAKGDGSTDDTAAFEAAWRAAVAGGGVHYIPPGNYKTSGTVGGDLQGNSVIIWGDPGAQISYAGSGDCVRMYDSSSYTGFRGSDWRSGVYGFLVIDGTNSSAAAASTGLHIGDILGLGIYCSVNNFSRHAGSIGVHFDNNYAWTEQSHGRIHVASNGTNVMFDNSANISGGATGSFDRTIIDIFVESNGLGDGVTLTNGAIFLDGRLGMYGNFSTSTTQYAVLRITGNNSSNASLFQNSIVNIGVELDDTAHTAPYTIFQGTTGVGTILFSNNSGLLDFGSSNLFTASNFVSADFQNFWGPILGDANLLLPAYEFQQTIAFAENVTVYGAFTNAGSPAEFNDTTIFGALSLDGASTSIAPLYLPSGALNTTAQAGAIESDGTAFYATAAASSRQVVATEQVQVLSSTRTFTSNTSAQAIFNATTNGALTVQGATTYEFECLLNASGFSASSHTIDFGFGGTATFTGINYLATMATTAGGNASIIDEAVATAAAITNAGTGTILNGIIRGTMRINAGGTIIPQLTQVTASAAAVVQANSFFRCWPIGSNTVTNVGDWS